MFKPSISSIDQISSNTAGVGSINRSNSKTNLGNPGLAGSTSFSAAGA
jgi:hypothetical protein